MINFHLTLNPRLANLSSDLPYIHLTGGFNRKIHLTLNPPSDHYSCHLSLISPQSLSLSTADTMTQR